MESRVTPESLFHDLHSGPQSGLDRRDFLKAALGGFCSLCFAALPNPFRTLEAHLPKRGFISPKRSPWFSPLPDRHVRCELCPKHCRIRPGGRGACRVRTNQEGDGYTLAYGNPCLVQVDPVEGKPFFHVLPGSRALSVSTAGCPLECKFCEVWDMALVAPEEVHAYDLPPETVVEYAKAAGVRSVSYAFGEPVAFFEYMTQTAALAREAGLWNLAHTSGYISPEPLEELSPLLDAVNVDLKSFDPAFYRDMCGADLSPVLATLKRFKAADVHIEITNLLIPTVNDNMGRIMDMCRWIRDELGPGVPLHFARFYPLYKLANLPPTPVSTLDRARNAAQDAGLEHVYVARVTGHEGENTFCPACGTKVIQRMGFVIEGINLKRGKCGRCGTPISGRWED
jgi:pyruvate formate lyase activating enzyme